MKSIFKLGILAVCCLAWRGETLAATHVIDVSTGIDDYNQLIAIYTTPDDDWTVKLPNTSVFIPTYCGTGTPLFYSTYPGKDPSVRWICPLGTSLWPFLLPSGEHNDAPVGIYEYKMTFDVNVGEVQSAEFNFEHIGGDNNIFEILVNGNPYPVNYGFNPFSNGVTLPIVSTDISSGTNTIIVRVNNTEKYTGMEINGNLTIVDNSADPNFWLTYTNGVLQGNSNDNGSQEWNVYCTPNGNTGPYTLVGTFDAPSFTMDGTCKCYYVTHTSTNDCGQVCSAQSICTFECGENECNLSTPTGLGLTHIDASHDQFWWNPVPGAVSYVLVLSLGDPTCCGWPGGDAMPAPPVVTFPVTFNSETVDLDQLPWPLIADGVPGCYSWYVYAVCADGSSSMTSALKCSSDDGSGIPDERPGASTPNGATGYNGAGHTTVGSSLGNAVPGSSEGASMQVYPNPASEAVTIGVKAIGNGKVNISIVDINGRIVKTFNNLAAANGTLSLTWDAGSLDNGIYLVKVITPDNQVLTQNLVVK